MAAYRGPDLKGSVYLAAHINKTFTIRVLDENGQVSDVQYGIYKDARGYLKVSAPNVAPTEKEKDKKKK